MSGHCLTPLPFPWKTNVMGLLGECRLLLVSILCPPVAYYVTSEAFEKPPAGIVESCIGGYCLCCGFLLRTRLRDKYNLDGSLLGDFLTHCCCHCVALARIWREAEVQADAEMQQQQRQQMQNNQAQNVSLDPMHSLSLQHQMSQQLPPPQQPQHFMPPGLQQMGYAHPFQPSPMYMPMPQPAVMMRPMGNVLGQVAEPVVMDHRNTIDTNLSSDFESRNEALGLRQDTGSCVRHNSMDPPPSNTDPDPWGMFSPQASLGFPAPPVDMTQPDLKTQQSLPAEKRSEQVLQDQSPHERLSYEAFVANELADMAVDDPTRPFPIGQIKEEVEPKKDLMTKRLAGLRPPNQHPAESEATTAKQVTDAGAMADQVMLDGMNYVKILSIAPGDADPTLQAANSQEDPPQHQAVDSRVESGGESKNGGISFAGVYSVGTAFYLDGSFLTQGGTAGSEQQRMSLNEFSGDTPRQ